MSANAAESPSETTAENAFALPRDVPTLVAMRAAIDKRIAELKTAGVQALRTLIIQESAALGMSPEEVLGTSHAAKRGRKPPAKRED